MERDYNTCSLIILRRAQDKSRLDRCSHQSIWHINIPTTLPFDRLRATPPFGAARTIPNSPILSTDFTYTGQRKLDDGMGGIMDYKARFYSPYINRFLQPDSIIPDQTNPQSWNRFGYVTNRPINFNDPSGHFSCVNNSSASISEDDCVRIIDAYLVLLATKGGKEGQALVKAFNNADGEGYCGGRGICVPDKNLITFTVVDSIEGGVHAQYATNGANTFTITADLMHMPDEDNIGDLAGAGVFGHEIDHLENGILSGTLDGEAHAYDIQLQIYENMGIATLENYELNGDINQAMWLGNWADRSEEEWYARLKDKYPNAPRTAMDKLYQGFTNQFVEFARGFGEYNQYRLNCGRYRECSR